MDQNAEQILLSAFVLIAISAFVVPYFAGVWKAFDKAREPGWSCLVPIYNYYAACRLGGRSVWWFLMLFIPVLNIFALVGISIGVARNYGKSELFGFGLAFLPYIFWPILGYGKSPYIGPRLV